MKTKLFTIALYTLSIFSISSAQNKNNDCPPLYTRSEINNPKIKITQVEIIDSSKYSSLPQFVLSEDSLSKRFMYPEIAKRAGIEGDVIVRVKIDSNGTVSKAKIIKGIGAGCDEAVLDVFYKTIFHPSMINQEAAPSSMEICVNFMLSYVADKPDFILDEIIYEINSRFGNYKILRMNKFNRATFLERKQFKFTLFKEGEIPSGLYTKLSDFIISQCFFDYKANYSDVTSVHATVMTITVVKGAIKKSISTYGYDGDPIGLWAIINLIPYVENQIKWNEDEK